MRQLTRTLLPAALLSNAVSRAPAARQTELRPGEAQHWSAVLRATESFDNSTFAEVPPYAGRMRMAEFRASHGEYRRRSIRFAAATVALLLLPAAPVRAGWSVAYAPGVNLERLDATLLGRAERSIDMAAYVLTDVPVIEALAAVGVRGVHVRVYREPEEREPRGAVAAPNVAVRFKRGSALMHLKSYLMDGRVLRGGAANFSASGLKSQDNDRFETDDPTAVTGLRTAFEAMWGR